MKTAVYYGTKSIKLEEKPQPQAGPGEVIVKVALCGICGTDVHAYLHEGLWAPGTVFGHEIVGTVSETGSGVTGWNIGDRVAVRPSGTCGTCHYCRKGNVKLCLHGFDRTLGLSLGFDGGLAEFVRVRYPKEMLYRLPQNLSFEDAVLAEPIAVAFGGVRQSRFRTGDNVVVVGAGIIGLAAVQLLRMAGARHITALNRSASRRELAKEYGADLALNPNDEPDRLRDRIIELYGGIGADVVYECAGVPDAVRTSIGLVKSGGQVLLLGSGDFELPVREIGLIVRDIELKASLTYNEEFGLTIDFLAGGRFDTHAMLSGIVPLERVVEEGFEKLAQPNDLVKIAVAPSTQ